MLTLATTERHVRLFYDINIRLLKQSTHLTLLLSPTLLTRCRRLTVTPVTPIPLIPPQVMVMPFLNQPNSLMPVHLDTPTTPPFPRRMIRDSVFLGSPISFRLNRAVFRGMIDILQATSTRMWDPFHFSPILAGKPEVNGPPLYREHSTQKHGNMFDCAVLCASINQDDNHDTHGHPRLRKRQQTQKPYTYDFIHAIFSFTPRLHTNMQHSTSFTNYHCRSPFVVYRKFRVQHWIVGLYAFVGLKCK